MVEPVDVFEGCVLEMVKVQDQGPFSLMSSVLYSPMTGIRARALS